MGSYEKAIVRAKLAEQADRYDDMVKYMKEAVGSAEKPLTAEERNLLSVAYKNVIGSKRSSLRVLTAVKERKETDDTIKRDLVQEYIKEVEKELNEVCLDIVQLLDEKLLPSLPADDTDAQVFCLKLKGDYFRYLSEIINEKGERNQENVEKARVAYEQAKEAAEKLSKTHPVRLGLALNFSVYYYEIDNDSKKACKLAKEAFDEAIGELDNVQDDTYKDSTLIMQLLRDNLTLWTSDNDEAGVDGSK